MNFTFLFLFLYVVNHNNHNFCASVGLAFPYEVGTIKSLIVSL